MGGRFVLGAEWVAVQSVVDIESVGGGGDVFAFPGRWREWQLL